MTAPTFRDWQSVQAEVLRRIHAREWKPGDLIPNEADLAQEFGCARTTVNRALRALADSGLLDRRRKAGTRVAAQPVAKATLDISVIRAEIQERGQKYGYQRISHALETPPLTISAAMKTAAATPLLHVTALHLADDAPYALEDRWIAPDVVPDAAQQDFQTISANEWLLKHTPYTHGEISCAATRATATEAAALTCAPDDALLVMERLTWDGAAAVTKVRLLYHPGHQVRTNL